MRKSILVVGVGRFGRGLIEALYELGHEIFAIDSDEEALNEVRDMVLSGAIINVAENDQELIRIVGKKSFDAAVVAITREFEGALIAAHILKEAGIPIYAKAANKTRGNILMKLGVEQVIFPEHDSGRRLAHLIDNVNAIDILELPQGYVVEQIIIGPGYDNKTIQALNTNNRLGIWFLVIYHGGSSYVPDASSRLYQGDIAIIFGRKENMKTLERENSKA
ncbi:MAG: TrkA family potassium uptake protein [Syntrophomonadaceae bacterium]